jgi:hypothetical protein
MNLTRLIFRYAALSSICILTASIVSSQNLSSAKILSSNGSVQITRRAGGVMNRVKLRLGDELFAGDVIKTGVDGRLVIGLKDGSQAIISPGTNVEIKDTNNSPARFLMCCVEKRASKSKKWAANRIPIELPRRPPLSPCAGQFLMFSSKKKKQKFLLSKARSA